MHDINRRNSRGTPNPLTLTAGQMCFCDDARTLAAPCCRFLPKKRSAATLDIVLCCQALRSLSGYEDGEAAKKAAGLLRNIFSTGRSAGNDADQAEPAPLVITIGRPFQRSVLREALGCAANSSDTQEEWEDSPVGATEIKRTAKETSLTSWRQLCTATNIGLEKLRSGAVLLTVELPSAVHCQVNEGVSKAERGIASARYTQEQRAAGSPSAGSPLAGYRITSAKGEERAEPPGDLSGDARALTEAAMIQAVAHTLVEAADILVLPLLNGELVSTSRPHDIRGGHEFGELICVGSTGRGTEGSLETKTDTSLARGKSQPSLQTEQQPMNAQVRLPEDVSQLLQAMKQLINKEARQEGASSLATQSRIHPSTSRRSLSPGAKRPPRLPLIVVALEGPVSRSRREAIRAEILAQLGTAEGKRVPIQSSYYESQAEDKLAAAYAEYVVWDDALGALLTRQFISDPPNMLEFATHAVSSNMCAAAFRLCLEDARKELRRLQRRDSQNAGRQSFGSVAQGILSNALTLYDYRTRKYQLSLQRRALREELARCVEREIRTIFLREALQIETSLRLSLRADLVAALQRNARDFESVAPGIIRKSLMTLDERLTRLLPHAVGSTAQRPADSLPSSQVMPPTLPEQSVLTKISNASARACRSNQLCRGLYRSLLEIHVLLLKKSARDFSAMAAELSGSPLAALLRQQHVGSSKMHCGNS
ncbi:hypothetical protein, conserved [Eimeria praecox]|uniref:Uncharacterized protein n=1 Tax=Eimeria praecox TaxID=51316 RepID=U6G6W8_9EIME|nr:hypothetical protein, conserved [Eimeria praecox]